MCEYLGKTKSLGYLLDHLIEHVPLRQMDNVISQAQATLGTLVLQRSTFGGINSKLSNVSSRLPSVSGHFIYKILWNTTKCSKNLNC